MGGPSLWDLPPELYGTLASFLDLSSLIALSQSSSASRHLVLDHLAPSHIRSRAHIPTPDRLRLINQCKWLGHIDRNFTQARMSGFSLPISAPLVGDSTRVVPAHHKSRNAFEMPCFRLWVSNPETRNWRCLVTSRRSTLQLWHVGAPGSRAELAPVPMAPNIVQAGGASAASSSSRLDINDDITSIILASGPDGALGSTDLIIARLSGLMQRIRIEEPSWHATQRRWIPGRFVEVAQYSPAHSTTPTANSTTSTIVQSISSGKGLLISASTRKPRPSVTPQRSDNVTRVATPIPEIDRIALSEAVKRSRRVIDASTSHWITIHFLISPWLEPLRQELPTKPWSTLMIPSSNDLVVGSSGYSPLSLGTLTPTSCSPLRPIGIPLSRPSSIYSLASPTPLSPLLNPAHTVLSAYYNSSILIHDLRLPNYQSQVFKLEDPWSDDPAYSVACGGAAGAWVAGGSARNASIRLWDLRSSTSRALSLISTTAPPTNDHQSDSSSTSTPPATRSIRHRDLDLPNPSTKAQGLTLFSPHRDDSPIYALEFKLSRLWACTDKRIVGIDWDRVEGDRGRGLVRWEGVGYYEFGDEEGEPGKFRMSW
ncbi:BZ3500_MvSof-1268-A1-R1_Chr9g10332 [Microbotryum saponariae]|uniref:BZ3500_MvSof-1268-A1-R1_Chr9g10332 protein n=1 Tax=Microbotryum saponariae TaxID=289078 RepID=A0A2X0MDG0_9BASI|nr:BZ3501_MvSof-1269-A2-R1_Chr9g10082 [Microbotryum saponariae]SCZ99912.1 BZ3500_MvSof-1268-A1-R1_Chr9g10332 [Microbotryum saponariae]